MMHLKEEFLLLDFAPLLCRIFFGQLYYSFYLACQKVYYLFYVLYLDFHLLKVVFFTSNHFLTLLLAMLATLLVPGSLRFQQYWTRLQTLSLKMPKESTKVLKSCQNPFFFFFPILNKIRIFKAGPSCSSKLRFKVTCSLLDPP